MVVHGLMSVRNVQKLPERVLGALHDVMERLGAIAHFSNTSIVNPQNDEMRDGESWTSADSENENARIRKLEKT